MSKVFKYYYDLMSQPSRALWIALRLGKIPYDDCPVALRKREHLTEEFKKINRFQKIPCIVDGDFHLAESVSILRFLSEKGQFSDSLYPKALQERARVDEFLDWHHLTLRYGCSMYFLRLWLFPMNGLAKPPTPEETAKLAKEMEGNLDVVEQIWLQKSKFLTGDQLTVADLFGACEVEQLRLTKYDVGKRYPLISKWLADVRQETNPFYDEAHKFILKKSGSKL